MQLPELVRSFFPGTSWREGDDDSVYITFDDGPVPEATPWVLDELDKAGAKATFFCVGDNVRKYPDIYKEVLARGHRVGNHTYNHTKAWSVSRQKYFDNIEEAKTYIDSTLFRPPHGQLYPWYIKKLKESFAKIVMWDVLTQDYDNRLNGKTVFTNLTTYVRGGSIVVFHDSIKSFKNLEYALPASLEWLQEKEFKARLL